MFSAETQKQTDLPAYTYGKIPDPDAHTLCPKDKVETQPLPLSYESPTLSLVWILTLISIQLNITLNYNYLTI